MKLQRTELSGPVNAQVVGGPAIRFSGAVYFGGQQYNTEDDEKAWIEDRIVFNTDMHYKGFWAMKKLPMRAAPANLTIRYAEDLAVNGGIVDGARVPANAALEASWALMFGDTIEGGLEWESTIRNAQTGAIVSQLFPVGNSHVVHLNLPALAAGSYLWHVRLKSAAQGYTWPPPDYTSVTGKSAADLATTWESDVYGTVHYDPIYHVGLVPPDGHPLALARAANVEAGQAIKVPQWVEYVTYLGEDGTYLRRGGEYASLRLIAGGGAWIGDTNCHVNSTPAGPCMWRATGPNTSPIPVMIDPTARICGAFYREPETNDLWVGLAVAGRDGRTVRLLKMNQPATGGAVVIESATRWCECALSNEAPNKIVRYPDLPLSQGGVLHAVTFCSQLKLNLNADFPEHRLEERHPGGRSLTVVPGAGNGGMIFATESDFATSAKFPFSFNYILAEGPNGQYVAAGTSHHIFDTITAWGNNAYYVEEEVLPAGTLRHQQSLEAAGENNQYLNKFDGGHGVRVAAWKVKRYDMGAICAAGRNVVITGDGAGVPGVSMRPAAMRYTGDTLQEAKDWPYWVRRMQAGHSADGKRQTIIGCGLKENPNAPGVPLPGYYVFETTGEPTTITFCFDEETLAFYVSRDAVEAAFYIEDELPLYLIWRGFECWQPSNTAPADDAVYLIRDSDEDSIFYKLPPGRDADDLPYDVEQFPCFVMSDPDSCFTPLPGCNKFSDCYEGFPEGSTLYAIEMPARNGVILSVMPTARTRNPQSQLDEVANFARLYPNWLWLGRDTNLGYLAGLFAAPVGPELLAALDNVFDLKARVNRTNKLLTPALKNVVMLAIIPPGYEFDFVLGPVK